MNETKRQRYPRTRARNGAPVEERLMRYVIVAPSGCWIWVGACSSRPGRPERYGRIQLDGKCLYAHRVSYETFVGPIPDGYECDHLCRRTACIRPEHLQAVTPQINNRRGTAPGARAQRRENCLRGHSYAEHGVVRSGRRVCRVCSSETARRFHERNPEKASEYWQRYVARKRAERAA